MSHGSGPCLPVREGSGTATCHTAPDLASLLEKALMLSRVTRLWTPPPCSGGLQFCHMPHGSGPCLPAQEGSGAITCLATLRGLHALTIKKGLADLPMQQDSRVSKTRLHVTEAPTRRGADGVIMTYKPCGQALQHRAIVHHRAADRSQTWRCSTTLRS
jgi:hypothetical protein